MYHKPQCQILNKYSCNNPLFLNNLEVVMCDVCRMSPCDSRCPNAPEPEVFGRCINCGRNIYDGDDFYDIGGDYFCEECINDCHTTAEVY